jgi:bacterioferritin
MQMRSSDLDELLTDLPVPLRLWNNPRHERQRKVLERLNHALREELTAINQYFLHAEMCENWGYDKLSKYIKKQSIGEMKHAEALIERILFLDGTPTMDPLCALLTKTGTTVPASFSSICSKTKKNT